MRYLLSICLLVTSACTSTSCASSGALGDLINPAVPPGMSPVLRIITRFNLGHACPVASDVAFTAAHLLDVRPFDANVPLLSGHWSDNAGNAGLWKSYAVAQMEDVGAIYPVEGEFKAWYARANAAPAVGSPLWIVGYDYRGVSEAFRERVWRVKVLRVVAHHIIVDEAPDPGSSGSCALNADGEIVGINIGRAQVGSDSWVGIVVGVWTR